MSLNLPKRAFNLELPLEIRIDYPTWWKYKKVKSLYEAENLIQKEAQKLKFRGAELFIKGEKEPLGEWKRNV